MPAEEIEEFKILIFRSIIKVFIDQAWFQEYMHG